MSSVDPLCLLIGIYPNNDWCLYSDPILKEHREFKVRKSHKDEFSGFSKSTSLNSYEVYT